jgi:pimeloyl-ACP methyl ester carboxylesterase
MHIRLGDVDTWYDEHGAGAPLVLLHPGGADSRAWEANLPPLAERFHVYTPDRRGHGRTADVAGPITFDAMARDTIAFIEAVTAGPVDLVGCSDGASVALLVAWMRPDLVQRLVFVCGVFHHEGWLPGSIELDEEADAFLGDWYGEVSPDGREHWPVVKAKLHEAHLSEPALTRDDLARVPCPTLVMQGDRDEMPIEHSAELFRALPDAQLAVVPGASHGLLVERPELCNAIIANFLS